MMADGTLVNMPEGATGELAHLLQKERRASDDLIDAYGANQMSTSFDPDAKISADGKVRNGDGVVVDNGAKSGDESHAKSDNEGNEEESEDEHDDELAALYSSFYA